MALRYVREESDAPIVVAKGQDLIALRIREIATQNNIPIFEDPPLARSMFAQVSVDSVIPSVFYKAVAETHSQGLRRTSEQKTGKLIDMKKCPYSAQREEIVARAIGP